MINYPAPLFKALQPSQRILMGPGPSDVSPQVLRALSSNQLGHLDPEFLQIMDQNQSMLRYVFQTSNQLTLPVSATGSAGMETCLVNLLEPGDRALVFVNGVFGQRMAEVARRVGAEVHTVERPWGEVFGLDEIEAALSKFEPKLLAIVHAETSTGAQQNLEGIGDIAHSYGALLVVDAVTSLAGTPVLLDQWGVDACYSGTQKCLSCPPGLSPVSFSDRALTALRERQKPVQSWYLDLSMVQSYWGGDRIYHHTAPISMNYALHEALRAVCDEGLEKRWARHQDTHKILVAGLEAMGLQLQVAKAHRLPQLNAVTVPAGIDELKVRKQLLQTFGIEIGGGLGEFKGKVWRIGLMGESCKVNHVFLLISALEQCLKAQGHNLRIGAGLAAAGETMELLENQAKFSQN